MHLWSHDQPGHGLWQLWEDEQRRTPHDKFIFSGGYWVTQAVRRSPFYTTDLDAAEVVLVSFHCYLQAWLRAGRDQTERAELQQERINRIRKLMVHIQSTPRFQASAAKVCAVGGEPLPLPTASLRLHRGTLARTMHSI